MNTFPAFLQILFWQCCNHCVRPPSTKPSHDEVRHGTTSHLWYIAPKVLPWHHLTLCDSPMIPRGTSQHVSRIITMLGAGNCSLAMLLRAAVRPRAPVVWSLVHSTTSPTCQMIHSECLIPLASTSKFHIHTVYRCVSISYCTTRVSKTKCFFFENAVKAEIIDCFNERDFDDHTPFWTHTSPRLKDPVLAHPSFPGSMKHKILSKKVRLLD